MDRDELRFRLAGGVGALLVRGLGATLRYRVEGAEHYLDMRKAGRPVIFAFWHSGLLPLVYLHRNQQAVALVSQHRDGEYIARVMERCGLRTARGSSTRGGARGLREMLRAAKEGRDLAITPDGPKGPPRRFKEGGVVLARLTGLPLIPTAIGAERAWRLGSWDRFLVPKPFSPMHVRYAAPIEVPRHVTDEEAERLRERLEGILNRITDEVDGASDREEGARPPPARPPAAPKAGDGST